MREFWVKIQAMFRREQLAEDLREEAEVHLQMEIEANTESGLSPDQALQNARRDFGNRTLIQEAAREAWVFRNLDLLLQDLRYGWRSLRKNSAVAAVMVLTLAVGIGANTAIFSLLNQLLLNPAGISHPERVVTVRTRYAKQNIDCPCSTSSNLADLRASTDVFEHAALGGYGWLNFTGDSSVPERLAAIPVTSGWFNVFDAKPLLGRLFTPEEDQPNMNRVVVLSYAAWTRLFGADRGVIGRTALFDQVPYQIIGVMRSDFRWPQDADVWTPLGLSPELLAPRNRFNESYTAIARTRSGVSPEQARAWLGVLTDRVRNADKGGAYARASDWSITVVPFTDNAAGDNKTALLMLSGAVGLVLLIVCANIAGLMVARMTARARELTVRAALGAGRSRLMRQVFTEALLLAAVGGALGLGLTLVGLRVLIAMAPLGVSALNPELDVYALAFCAGATLASGLLFGLGPAWQMSRLDLQGALKAEGRSSAGERARQRLRSFLVVGETALALTLLVGAGLFIRSFVNLQQVDPGFDPRGVMTATSILSAVQYPGGQAQANFYRTLLARLRAAPGVVSAGLGWPLPMGIGGEAGSFEIEGRVVNPNDPPAHGERRFISPGYMETLSIPLKRGRYFTDADRIDAEMVTVIDENLAKQYWPGEDPLGKRIRMGTGAWSTIVGIVGHLRHSSLAADSGKGVYYFPLFQRSLPSTVIAVKATGDPAAMSNVIREAVRAADPNHPITALRTMESYVAGSLATRRFGMRLMGFFAGVALFLAALGLYGVINYMVTQRTREIGIRMALGASRQAVMRLVLGHGVFLAGLGIALGALGALAVGRLLEAQLFDVRATDPLTISGMAMVMLATALAACFLPARRAIRVDPAVTLRDE